MSSSILTNSSDSAVGNLENSSNETEYLLSDAPKDLNKLAAEGISLLFSRFPYEIQTFQFIRADPNGKTSSPVHLFKDPKKALSHSLKLNKNGYDVFFMVNEGDGIIHPGKRIPRSQVSVLSLSKCFIDSDNCPIERIDSYLNSINLVPHLRIESSPNRFHLYFFIDPVEKTDANIEKWRAVQNILHRLGDVTIKNPAKTLGTDSTMHDFSKVLRVPGFTHVKKRFVSRIVASADLPNYTLDELFSLTSAQSFIDHLIETTGNGESNVPDLDATDAPLIDKGDRYQHLQALAMHLANQDMDTKEKVKIFANFCRTRIDNSDLTYVSENNALTQKSLDLLQSALAKVKREKAVEVQTLHHTLATINDPKPSAWELPDSFYLSAPNGFGDVVRQAMEYSMYPCAALAFGTFITGLSILKAKNYLTPHGSSPALYTLNVAISGYGKGDPMTLLQNLFVSLGHGSLIENEIRSDRTIYNHLAVNHGTGLCILDEIAPLLRVIQDENATSHHANISKALLYLYSAGAMKGVSFGKVASSSQKKGEQAIVIDNPMLAVLGFTVPEEFDRLFNAESVAKGLFQRFIPIVAETKRVPKSPLADKTAIIRSDLFKLLPSRDTGELPEEGEPVPPLQTVPLIKMPFTVEARAAFEAIEESYRDKLIESARDPERAYTSGLYSRIAEQIERIATVLSMEEIDLTTLEYAAAFMESRHQATMAVAEKSILRGRGSESMMNQERIMSALVRLCRETDSVSVTKRSLFRSVRRHFGDMKEFEKNLNELRALERVEFVQVKQNRKTVESIKLSEVLD